MSDPFGWMLRTRTHGGRALQAASSGDPDDLQLYIADAERYPLLTHEQMVALARTLQTGGRGSKAAKERLICSNLRLVFPVARHYVGHGLSLLDLIQQGNLGLMRAVEKWDPERGRTFSTYAVWWIRQSILRGIGMTGEDIRVPVYVFDARNRMRNLRARLTAQLGRAPTDDELLAAGARPTDIEYTRLAPLPTLSLDRKTHDQDDDWSLKDTVQDDDDQISAVEERVVRSQILDLLSRTLTKREYAIIVRRFGLDGYEAETLERVGKSLRITRERVRQIEAKALEKLRKALGDKAASLLTA